MDISKQSPAIGNDDFYAALPGFTDFDAVVDFDAYVPLPLDWTLLVSDVRGSTRAIREGRYKDVNMLGAATITAVLNACRGADLPFAFGGDGGVIVVPPAHIAAASAELARLAASAPQTFGLSLRAAAIPVGELVKRGAMLGIRKYTLSPGNHLAMFSGNGLEVADQILKAEGSSGFALDAPDDELPDLTGLSCRWEPLVPEAGTMMSVIVKPQAEDDAARKAVLDRVLDKTARVIGHGLSDSAPVRETTMRFRWPPRGLMLEARTAARGRNVVPVYLRLMGESLVQAVCQRFGWRAGSFDAPAYQAELRTNTDFRKFDGHLRMVLDIGDQQATALSDWLDSEYAAGALIHGVHRADAALMTCLVFSLEQSEHVHFIDGANGGYALAAADMKARLASR